MTPLCVRSGLSIFDSMMDFVVASRSQKNLRMQDARVRRGLKIENLQILVNRFILFLTFFLKCGGLLKMSKRDWLARFLSNAYTIIAYTTVLTDTEETRVASRHGRFKMIPCSDASAMADLAKKKAGFGRASEIIGVNKKPRKVDS